MKRPVPVESASAFIDEKIKELGDWRAEGDESWVSEGRFGRWAFGWRSALRRCSGQAFSAAV